MCAFRAEAALLSSEPHFAEFAHVDTVVTEASYVLPYEVGQILPFKTFASPGSCFKALLQSQPQPDFLLLSFASL